VVSPNQKSIEIVRDEKLTELIASWRVGLGFLAVELPKRRFMVGMRWRRAARGIGKEHFDQCHTSLHSPPI
jgi:hypothetical protein